MADRILHASLSPQDNVVPLRLVKKEVSLDALATIRRLEELAQEGEIQGIAFAAILRGGRTARGVTDGAIEQSYTTVGILTQVISDLSS